MNKNALKIVILVVILIAVACLVGGYFLLKYIDLEKDPIKAKEFISVMEDEDFEVVEVTEQFEGSDVEVKEGYVALGDDYQIEFYIFSDEENAEMFYKINKAKFESSSATSEVAFNGKNYSSYGITTGGKYKFVERVEKTVIYLNVDKEYKDEVKDIIEELGY